MSYQDCLICFLECGIILTCEGCSWYLCGLFSGRISGYMGLFGCSSERCFWYKENHSRGSPQFVAVISPSSFWNFNHFEYSAWSFQNSHNCDNFQAQYLAETVGAGLGNIVGKVLRRWIVVGRCAGCMLLSLWLYLNQCFSSK